MKKNTIKSAAFILGATLLLSGCGGGGSSSSGTAQTDPLELESNGKTLIFYSASSNEQYGFEADTQKITNLQEITDDDGHDISNFNMAQGDEGRLFVWLDDKGDENASNDEEKVIMFKQDYSFKNDGNATWENFYYLGHFHAEESSYELAAHTNDEFDVTDGAKYEAMVRLNKYLATQDSLEENLSAAIPEKANGLCGFHTFVNEEGHSVYYAMGKNGTLYIYNSEMSLEDSVVVTDSCTPNQFGMSSTEDGVLFFSAPTQELFAVDSHDDGIHHVHTTWDVSELIGSGTAEMMVAIKPLVE